LLTELHIRNFAVIEEMRLQPDSGLTILSGEEGAGKSLIVDALGALLGLKAAGMVRQGSRAATVEAVFQPDKGTLRKIDELLAGSGIPPEADGSLILAREIQEKGRSLGRINGRAVPLTLLKQAGMILLDLHSQMDFLSLLDTARQRDLLDAFGKLEAARVTVNDCVEKLRAKTAEIDAQSRQTASVDTDYIRYQLDEIEQARLSPDDEDNLQQEAAVMRQAQLIREASEAAYDSLYNGDISAYQQVHRALESLREAGNIDPVIREQHKGLEAMVANLEDSARELRRHGETLAADAGRLENIEQRLDYIATLKRKHGGTIADVLAAAAKMQATLAANEDHEGCLGRLAGEKAALEKEAGGLAVKLSQARQSQAMNLSKLVNEELADLELPHASFAIEVSLSEHNEGLPAEDGKRYSYTRDGIDRVEFMVRTNPGEKLRPLADIASGGETSRIILAIKSALKRADPVPTLVFDEIDMGIGGRSGDSIGRKLVDLSGYHQVLCITHLPQIACFGDSHFRLVKETGSGRAVSRVEEVSGQARVAELAAMLGAAGAPQAMQAGAGELLAHADDWKTGQGKLL
jgi:DNA repair protein RecN (Recombination protein N)